MGPAVKTAWLFVLYAIIWATALVLSVALFAVSTSTLSRILFALAAYMAGKRLINGPFIEHPEPPQG